MQQRGRKSSAASAVVVALPGRLPQPPADLTDEAKEIWQRVTASENPDFFATAATQQLLALYCQHMSTAAKLGRVVEAAMNQDPAELEEGERPASIKDINALLSMRDRESKSALTLATKLRLTNQSRFQAQTAGVKAKQGASSGKLWDRKGL